MSIRPDDMPGDGRSGSVHDPSVQLPPAMWDRPMAQTAIACRMCAASSVASGSTMLEVARAWRSSYPALEDQRIQNEQGPLALVCSRCDRVGDRPKVADLPT